MKTRTLLIILAILLVAVALGTGLSSCEGECAVIKCGPINPCNINGKQYVTGEMCANPGAVCDDGYIWDCHCVTKITGVGQIKQPSCDCE